MTDPTGAFARQAISACLAQREEILAAFVAKYGFQPDEAVQIEQRQADGSVTWRIERQPQPRPAGLTVPILASERLPEPYDPSKGEQQECDTQGKCWWWTFCREEGVNGWVYDETPGWFGASYWPDGSNPYNIWPFWLPANALPLPE
jgi:hypothetical protein